MRMDEVQCIYDVDGYHTVLSVKSDWDNPGNEIYGLAGMFCRIIKDGNYSADIIIEQMKQEFDCEKEESDD